VMLAPTDLSTEIKKRAALTLFGAIFCLLTSAGQVSAQAIDIPAIMNPDLNAPPTIATLQYGHQFKTDVDDNSEMSRNNAFLSLSQRIKVADKTSVLLLGSYTLQAYNFSGGLNADPIGGPPPLRSPDQRYYQWDDVHRGVIAALVGHDLNDRWRLIGGALVRSWGEGGANFGDTITGGIIAGFDYHPNEDFSIGLILGAFSALEDHVGILPVPTLKWQFAENWKWTVGLTTVLDPGVGSELEFTINDEFSIGAGFTYPVRALPIRRVASDWVTATGRETIRAEQTGTMRAEWDRRPSCRSSCRFAGARSPRRRSTCLGASRWRDTCGSRTTTAIASPTMTMTRRPSWA